jgi:hypothetical protein
VPGEFSISEAPIGDAGALGAALGPSYALSAQDVKFRYGERYASEAANKKFLGIPFGAYLGFIPSFNNNVLTLSPDPTFGVSLCRLASQDDPLYIVDVIVGTDVVLDFTNHSAFPVNVVVKARGKLGFAHSAEVSTQLAPSSLPTEVLIGSVTAPNTIIVDEPSSRDTPYAYSGTPLGYGFMKDGAAEELLNAVAVNAEVVAARTDLFDQPRTSLDLRLTIDGLPSAMALRLGLENLTILADDFVIAAPTDTINISRAFSRYHRSISGFTPVQNFDGFASEDRVGAITSGTIEDPSPIGALVDAERNVCAIIDATTESRLTDAARQVAYGRLIHDEITLTGTEIVFVSFGTLVGGIGTLFTTEVSPGDIIQDPISRDYFEVDFILTDNTLHLSSLFPNPTTPGGTAPLSRRRFTLNARTRIGPDTETPFVMPATTIRVYFNAWLTVEGSHFDYMTDLLRGFEEEPVPTATTTVPGKALLASGLTEGKAGAIFAIQEQPSGVQVGDPHVHTIDFDGAASGVAGVADISQRGPIGDQGPPGSGGTPGPVGPQGPQGQGFDNFSSANLFRESSLIKHSDLGSGTLYSFTTTMDGSEILFLTGGNSEWFSRNSFDSNDHWQIDDIEVVSGMTVRLSARVPIGSGSDAEVRFFLNAATR